MIQKNELPNPALQSQHGTEAKRRPRFSPETEALVLDHTFQFPIRGQDRVARDLWSTKTPISASGVRYIWQRHNLETLEKRVAWIESRVGKNDHLWTEEQLIARNRIRTDRTVKSLGASMVGRHSETVSRTIHIMAVAARLLRERSFEAISLRDIAASSHIPLGSIYYHFPTKEDLFFAVYEEGIKRLLNDLQGSVSTGKNPWEKLEKACIAHLNNLCGGDNFMAVSIPTRLPELSIATRNKIIKLNEKYENVFKQLVDELPISSKMSRTLMRLQILGALNWTSVWYRPDKMTPSEIASQLIKTFRYGS